MVIFSPTVRIKCYDNMKGTIPICGWGWRSKKQYAWRRISDNTTQKEKYGMSYKNLKLVIVIIIIIVEGETWEGWDAQEKFLNQKWKREEKFQLIWSEMPQTKISIYLFRTLWVENCVSPSSLSLIFPNFKKINKREEIKNE